MCTVLLGALIGIRAQLDFQIEVMALTGGGIADPDLYRLGKDILYGPSLTFIGFVAVGLLIALADTAMSRRRTEAAIMAAGTSTRVLVTAQMIAVFLSRPSTSLCPTWSTPGKLSAPPRPGRTRDEQRQLANLGIASGLVLAFR